MIEVVENQLSADGMKLVRVISDWRLNETVLRQFVPGAARGLETVRCWDTAALCLFYGEVRYPIRGVVNIKCGLDTPLSTAATRPARLRKFVAWRLVENEGYRVSEVIEILADWFFVQTRRRPAYAFMRKLPKEAVSGQRLAFGEELELHEAEWCLEKCVLVGG